MSRRNRGHDVDNWRRYLRDVRRHPLLDAREERRLILRLEAGRRAEAVLAEKDLPLRLRRLREKLVERGRAARDRLVEANLRLVIRIAVRYSQHERLQGMELLDLIQEGNIGLIMAVDNFESGHGKLSTFAAPWTRRRIHRAVAEQSRIIRLPTRAQARLERLGKEERWYRAWKGRPPTDDELMTELGVDAAELARLRHAEEQDVLSLQEPVPDDETGAVYEDFVEAPEAADFVQRIADREWLGRLLAGLPERSRRVLEWRFGHGWTLDQIGKRENLSRERVRQIEREALERLRQEDDRAFDQGRARRPGPTAPALTSSASPGKMVLPETYRILVMQTRLSTKGQLIIPKEIRDRHGWRPGSEIEVEDHGDAVILREHRGVTRTTLEDLVGCARYEGPRRSLEEMEEAIAKGARERR